MTFSIKFFFFAIAIAVGLSACAVDAWVDQVTLTDAQSAAVDAANTGDIIVLTRTQSRSSAALQTATMTAAVAIALLSTIF